MKTSWIQARKKIAIVWLIGGAIAFFLIFMQSLGTKYDDPGKVWNWFLPTVLPTMSLIVGVMVTDKKHDSSEVVPSFIFKMAFFLSIFYLLVLILPIMLEPLMKGLTLDKIMEQSNLWLSPLQGLVVAAIAVFFVKKESGSEDESTKKDKN